MLVDRPDLADVESVCLRLVKSGRHREVLMLVLGLTGMELQEVVSMRWHQLLNNIERRTINSALQERNRDQLNMGLSPTLALPRLISSYIEWMHPVVRGKIHLSGFVFATRQSDHISVRSAIRSIGRVQKFAGDNGFNIYYTEARSVGRKMIRSTRRKRLPGHVVEWQRLVNQSVDLIRRVVGGDEDVRDFQQKLLTELVSSGMISRAAPTRALLNKMITQERYAARAERPPIPCGKFEFLQERESDVAESPRNRAMRIKLLTRMLGKLPELEASIITLRCGLSGKKVHSLSATSKSLGIDSRRVKRLEYKAMQKLLLHASVIKKRRWWKDNPRQNIEFRKERH